MREKYEIEIFDKTSRETSVYVHSETSFYNAFLTAKTIQREYKYKWKRKTEIKRIEKIID